MNLESSKVERKLVTVVFADLVGSTELSVRQDAEKLRSLLAAFFEEMAQPIRAFGGTVEKYAGDAIMAVFGVPQVHEDDAERALRAALTMQEALAQLNPTFEDEYGVRLSLRVGIATGEAVAAAEETREFMVTGQVANLAARLQSAAAGIVVCAETHRLLAALIESEKMAPVPLKGFADPVTAYRITGLRRTDRKPRGFAADHTPVTGRRREMEILVRCAGDLKEARGRIVAIVGEAGLGKSRLKIELQKRLPEGVRWLEGQCHAHTGTTSYAPFIQILREAFRLGEEDPRIVARTKLRAALQSLEGIAGEQVYPVLAHLLDIEPGAGQADPRELQSRLTVNLRSLVEAMATQAPLILVLEDIQWADGASLELLTVLMELTDFLPLMILVVCRPDIEGGAWELRFHAQRNYHHRLTEIPLEPLTPEESGLLVRNLLRAAEIPEQLQSWILERSEGNPLFLEEIIRTLTEGQALLCEGNRWTGKGAADRLEIPGVLRGIVASRIDRLPGETKQVLQCASVAGRVFTFRQLEALTGGTGDLQRSTALLMRTALIREKARLPEPSYEFQHVLTQEAAYAGILDEERRVLHRRIALFLEEDGADSSGRHAALLARHWFLAGEKEKALEHTMGAAARAQKFYARPEAIFHYRRALKLLEELPRSAARGRTLVDAVLSLFVLPGSFDDAERMEEGLPQIDAAISAAVGSGDEGARARLEAMKGCILWDGDLLAGAVARAGQSGDPLSQAFAAEWYGHYLGANGHYEKAVGEFARAIDISAEAGSSYEQAMYMASGGRCYSARAGRLDEALDYASRALAIARTTDDARLRVWCAMVAEAYMYKGLWKDVVRVAGKGHEAAWKIGEWSVVFWLAGWLGIAFVKLGRLEEATHIIDRALKESRAGAAAPYSATSLRIAAAQLRLALGEPERALEDARAALSLAEESRFRLEQGAAQRVLGQVLEIMGREVEADAAFRLSLKILGDIQSRPELAQTLLACGRFRAKNNPEEGLALVERARSLFEEMGATGWIDEARTAL